MKRASLLIPATGLLVSLFTAVPAEAARKRVVVGPRGRVYVRVGPPAARVEVRGMAPSARHVWVGGYHRWDGRAYVWVPGAWVVGPRANAVWVPGHWKNTPHGWEWIDGHWK